MKLLDPRGLLRRSQLTLAARPARAALPDAAVVFYDNTKMDVGHYGLVFERIKAGLRHRSISRFLDLRETIRGKTTEDIDRLAERLASMSESVPIAAVIGLADMGVSPAMVTLSVSLERMGVPTVCLTAGPGAALSRAHASYRAGSLCLCELDLYPGSSRDEVQREADAAVDRIIAMLSSPAAQLAALAEVDHPIDRQPVASDGCITIDATDDGQSLDAVLERFEELHIGDGLPIVPPSRERYQAMARYCPIDHEAILMDATGPSGTPMRIRDALVACVMAGCTPRYVPIVLTALRAMSRPRYNLLQAVTTSFGGGHFILASGPIASEIGMHGGQGCLGPGFRANATIGRAVNLALSNTCRSVPGFADLACLSSPTEYSYCMAEGPSPVGWARINEERFGAGDTCVMVLKAESPHSLMDLASTTAASLMETIVDCCTSLGSNNAFVAGALVLVLNPDHARMLQEGGFDKDGIRRAVHASARIERSRLPSRGLVAPGNDDAGTAGFHHVTRSPADVEVVIAGGKGGHSAVIRPWALHSDPVFEAVRLPNGEAAGSLECFLAQA
ncbi:MAG: hypothetical protein ABI789_07555 [Usitatibacter sp.]